MSSLKRDLFIQLNRWKTKPHRLPLILWGARQVGKTTAVESFASTEFPQFHSFNFQRNQLLHSAFKSNLSPSEILKALEIISGKSIKKEDLVFFDEIQDCPEAVTSLKYFAELLPAQAVIAAGSYLGLVKNETSFPVGKVEFLSLHPLTYFEFLNNVEPATYEHLVSEPIFSSTGIVDFFHQRALHWLKIYMAIGGMPAAVAAFISQRDQEFEAALSARQIQSNLVIGYQGDFSKHSGTINANHILRVFDASALQVGKAQDESVNRFKFGGVIPGKKGFESIDGPLTWLEKSRLIIKTYMASRFEQPLKAFTQSNYFKSYVFDVGILNAMLGVPIESLLLQNLGIYKGYLAENFVAQELFSFFDQPLSGWTEGESEVEFVISQGADLCPIEVKASSRARRAKSLDTLISKYHPKTAIKLTGQNRGFSPERGYYTLPLYMVGMLTSRSSKA